MTSPPPEALPNALTDPLGVIVDQITRVEPGLDRTVVTRVAAGAAGGRAKRRRLAQALLDNPTLLTNGRSPAPRAVGDLLIALRTAGATHISPPVCAGCDKPLRTLQRRGQDWYCAVCSPRRKECAACGQLRIVATLDRHGKPRCKQCPDHDGRDPVAVLTEVVAGLDASLPAAAVATAARQVFSKPAKLQHLAWVIEDAPELLTGDGASAPIPGVLRLIDALVAAGAQQVTHPACPRCRRVVRLHRRINGQWHCRNCVAKSRAQPCSRCGTVREAATRDAHGQPLCPNCLITDPVNHERCTACGRRRRVSTRTHDGPLCENCRPRAILTCAVCGRQAACSISRTSGQPRCASCTAVQDRCVRCERVRPVAARTPEGAFCRVCVQIDPRFRRPCQQCGALDHLQHGCCARCLLGQRLRALLGDPPANPELELVYETLAATEPPRAGLQWLQRSAATTVLAELASGQRPLTHEALDELLPSQPVDHLRSVLVAAGALPVRDERLVRLERWVQRQLATLPAVEEQHLLRRYAVWHLLRGLRRRHREDPIGFGQADCARQRVRAAIDFLDWLRDQQLLLAACRQADLDRWAAGASRLWRARVGEFIRWAISHRLARNELTLPADQWPGPSRPVDAAQHWAIARRLLTDATIKLEYRVAGLLVALYAQPVSLVSRLTLAQVTGAPEQVHLQLGTAPILLPEPLAGLVRDLLAGPRGHARLGARGISPWLFPGAQPGQPIQAQYLRQQLHHIGVHPAQTRSAALLQLAAELPPAVLARLLGIHPTVAVAWQRAAGGDWNRYAADLSRRTTIPSQAMAEEK